MMSLTELESQALGAIADGLAGSDPRSASMLNIFTRLAADEEMPAREKTRVRRGCPPARPRRARRHRAGAQSSHERAASTRAWGGSRPFCCCGRSPPPDCSPSRCSSTPAATRPAPSRWKRRAALPLSHTMPMRPTFEPPASRRGLPAQTVGRLRNRSAGPTSAHDRQHLPARERRLGLAARSTTCRERCPVAPLMQKNICHALERSRGHAGHRRSCRRPGGLAGVCRPPPSRLQPRPRPAPGPRRQQAARPTS